LKDVGVKISGDKIAEMTNKHLNIYLKVKDNYLIDKDLNIYNDDYTPIDKYNLRKKNINRAFARTKKYL